MSKQVIVASAQYPISSFGSTGEWQDHVGSWVAEAVQGGADLLVFPEYGSMELMSLVGTGGSSLRAHLEGMQGYLPLFRATFSQLSTQWGRVIVAPSVPVLEEGRFVNRAYVFGPQGMAGWQDKFFMTRFEDEEWGVTGNTSILMLFDAGDYRFGIQTCYDVEFPLGSQCLCAAGASVILVPSCTETIRGATRVHVGARARALENQCYTVVSQTVGTAAWSPVVDVNHGYAGVYSPPDHGLPEEGIVAVGESNVAKWLYSRLDLAAIAAVRREGQVFNFKDQQRLGLQLDGRTPIVEVVNL